MKKQSGSRIVNLFKNIFNIRAWSDFDRVKSFTIYLVSGLRFLFFPKSEKITSKVASANFESAMAALNLSEADLLARQRGLYRLSILMCLFALGFLGYSLYHFLYGGIKGAIISLVLMLIAIVLAFRYHFWYFQIKERKLGCPFNEWYNQGFLGKKS